MSDIIETMARPGTASWDEPDEGFSKTVSRVQGLAHVEDEDETPTPHALSSALHFLSQTKRFLAHTFPRGTTTVSDDGSIDVYWRKPGCTLQLMIPADERRTTSVYHREGSDYGLD